MELADKRKIFNLAVLYPGEQQITVIEICELVNDAFDKLELDTTDNAEKKEILELIDKLLPAVTQASIIDGYTENFNALIKSGDESAIKAQEAGKSAMEENEEILELILKLKKTALRAQLDEEAGFEIQELAEQLTEKIMVITREAVGDTAVFSLFPKLFRKEVVAQYYEEKGCKNLAAAARYEAPQP